jgi:hypothetical protein
MHEKNQSRGVWSGRLRHRSNLDTKIIRPKSRPHKKDNVFMNKTQNIGIQSRRLRSSGPMIEDTSKSSQLTRFKRQCSAVQLAGLQKALATRQRNAQERQRKVQEWENRKIQQEAREAYHKAEKEAKRKALLPNLTINEITRGTEPFNKEQEEVNLILNSFSDSHPLYIVSKIVRICNPVLEQRYKKARERLKVKNVDEVFMFHGTHHANIQK